MATQQSSGSAGSRDFASAPSEENLTVATPISPEAAHSRARVTALENAVDEIKSDIKEIRDRQHSHHVRLLEIFGAGFLVLAAMLIGAYFIIDSKFDKAAAKIDKVNERIDTMSTTLTKVDTKLEDLLARVPPVQAPVPHR